MVESSQPSQKSVLPSVVKLRSVPWGPVLKVSLSAPVHYKVAPFDDRNTLGTDWNTQTPPGLSAVC